MGQDKQKNTAFYSYVGGNRKLIIKGNSSEYTKVLKRRARITSINIKGQTYLDHILDEVPEKPMRWYAEPIFKGHVIFCNGYLSDPATNLESYYNVLMRKDPDDPNSKALRGENMNEQIYTDPDDVLTNDELEELQNRGFFKRVWEDEVKTRNYPFPLVIIKSQKPTLDKFYGYWNDPNANINFQEEFGGFFNAIDNCHYINGSHGLRSSASHRIDHGIAQGYAWAKQKWGIRKAQSVEEAKEKNPGAETYSPDYKPITIVGHSQGAAMAAGVAVGVIAYAEELGWEEIPINLIFLGTHQPRSLKGAAYNIFLKANDQDFIQDWVLDDIAKLFTDKVFEQEQGIDERMNELLGGSNWGGLKKHAVQFTFPNDRALLVTRMGDIPGVRNACSEKDDFGYLGWQYAQNGLANDDGHDVREPDGYYFPKRLLDKKFKENGEIDEKAKTYKETVREYWSAASKYMQKQKYYKENPDERYSKVPIPLPALGPLPMVYRLMITAQYKKSLELKFDKLFPLKVKAFMKFITKHSMELNAHFGPVKYMFYDKALQDWGKYQGQTIWDRIQDVGEDIFYRVNTSDEEKPNIYKDANEEFADAYELKQKIKKESGLVKTSIVHNHPDINKWAKLSKQEVDTRLEAQEKEAQAQWEAQRKKEERAWQKATNPFPTGPKY